MKKKQVEEGKKRKKVMEGRGIKGWREESRKR